MSSAIRLVASSPTRREHLGWLVAAAGTVTVAVLLGTAVAPPDAVQGEAQRLMYVHVPVAWCAYLCFGLVLVASGWFLWRPHPVAGRIARAAAETGVALTALTLATGSLWGSMTWGTWWVWDARVTSTVAMGLIYAGYLAIRAAAGGPRGERVAAGVGVAGFVVVPVVHFSVLLWRTLHQPPTLLAPNLAPPIDARMAAALFAAVLATSVLICWVLRLRIAVLGDHRNSPAPHAAGAPVRR